MTKNNVTRIDQASQTCKPGVCATSGDALVKQVLRSFQYTMPGIEDTVGVQDDLDLIHKEMADLANQFLTVKRLMVQFADHHGSDESHVEFLTHLLAQTDLVLKQIDPDFDAYVNACDEADQQRQASEADAWAQRQAETHQRYLDHVIMGREYRDFC